MIHVRNLLPVVHILGCVSAIIQYILTVLLPSCATSFNHLLLPYYYVILFRFDLCAFDGASNVQKAGQVLSQHYPRMTCIHGAEHVVSLFLGDVFHLP